MTDSQILTEHVHSRLRAGDVVLQGGRRHMVVRVNDCRAILLPIEKTCKERTIKTGLHAGESIAMSFYGREVGISPNAEVEILERRGAKGVEEFLRSKSSRPKENPNNQTTEEGKENETMSKNSKLTRSKKRARGGLAAEALNARDAAAAAAGKTDAADKPKSDKPDPKPRAGTERRDYVASLFDGTHSKSEIVELTMKKFNIPEAKRKAVKGAVNNYPSNAAERGVHVTWKPENGKGKTKE